MPEAKLGTAVIRMFADTADFVKGVERAGTSLKKNAEQMRRHRRRMRALNQAGSRLTGMFRGLAAAGLAAAGAGGIGALVKNSIALADSTIKAARATESIHKAILPRIAALRRTWPGHISQEAFASGMTAFAKRVGEARVETGTMTTILKKMDEGFFRSIQTARR